MEHEDNAQFDNYLQSAQQNLQHSNNTGNGDALAGLGLGINVDGNVGCGGAIGEVGKYDELTGEDESEYKYIKEVNQSEKEQQADDIKHVGNGKSHVEIVDDEDDYDDEGMPSMQYRNNGNDEHHNGAAKDDFEAMHTDVGDFSQTSNTASTAEGGCIDMLQVDMKIEPLQQQQQQQHHHQHFDEEDPSSNGTSSLSENAPMPQQLTSTFDYLAENDDLMQNKENANPINLPRSPVLRPTELNFDLHASHLNPDAKEFVPSFGSNATSPTMSETADVEPVAEQPVDQLISTLSALPRHRLLSGDDDDFVARSPRKGREMDMDSENFVVPDSDLDFGFEANKRPHEFEQEEDLMGDQIESTLPVTKQTDDVSQSPTNLMEQDIEEPAVPILESTANDVMKKSIYMTDNTDDLPEKETIEDVLNSVQPLPTDVESLNSSFVEDVFAGTPEEARAIEELLSHDDDDIHQSHPPSIEEMKMNLQNVNNKDLARDLDMNSAAHMEESFYMEQQPQADPMNKEEQLHDEDGFYAQQFAVNESLLIDTTIPFTAEHNDSIVEPHEHENVQEEEEAHEPKMFINNDNFSENAKVMDYDEQHIVTNMSSPSPKSTVEEKHLMEETKEQLVAKTIQDGQQFVEELGKKMENLLSSGIECDLKQKSGASEDAKPIQFQNDEPIVTEEPHFQQIQSSTEAAEPQIPIEHELQSEQNEKEILLENNVNVAAEVPANTVDVAPAVEIATAAAVVAIAAAAVTATKTAAKKPEAAAKKAAPAAAKPAVAKTSTLTAAKKAPITKTSTTTTAAAAAAARPRTAPAKVPSHTASKTSVASTTVGSKKPATSMAGASKTILVAKTAASKPSITSRVSSTATAPARKSATTVSSASTTAATKPRPASAQPTKSSIAPVSAAKPKISPRATLTSQLRNKVAPTTATTSTTKATTVKSPTKPTAASEAATANKVAGATRIKSATSSAAAGTTSTTKLFTARPAPKTTTTAPIVTARTLSKTSPLKSSPSATKTTAASPRSVGTNLKAKATTKDSIKSPAQGTRKTPTKTGVAASKPSKDVEEKGKEVQVKSVEEKAAATAADNLEVANETFKLQNGSAEPVNANPIDIDGRV